MELEAELSKVISDAEYNNATDTVARLTKQHYDAMREQGFDHDCAMDFAITIPLALWMRGRA